MQQDIILKRPVITEKTMLAATLGKFTFVVDAKANKHQIAEVIEKQFKVNVVSVATSKCKGKEKRFGKKRMPSQMSDSKKAVVKLKKGQKIELFDVQEEKGKK